MSVSTLESLPNEILTDIFEKYINGVDIIIAFAHCQNQRFDAIISQSQRFYFNFINCQKDQFSLCLRHLPTYVERIEKLLLSEENTPGQIHSFLALFPLFRPFKQLRKLYFHLNGEPDDWFQASTALLSLSHTPINTISIKAKITAKILTFNDIIPNIFRLRTLKRLILIGDSEENQWDFLTNSSSNVEYLTISGLPCDFQHLQSIFRFAPRLKYLNVRLTPFLHRYHLINPSDDNIISMPTLRTLILSFGRHDLTKFDILEKHLKAMPVLRYLEIKAHRELLQADAWEALLQTSLPLLIYFNLQTTTSCVKTADFDDILASFETPFWIEKQNFYFMITKHQDFSRFDKDEMQINEQDEFEQPVTQWWIVPFRSRVDNVPTNKILNLGISGTISSLSEYYYFQNVQNLFINDLNPDLLQWLETYVNYSRIKYLDVSRVNSVSGTMKSLLSTVRNINALRIRYDDLLVQQVVYLGRDNCLKSLDISFNRHNFDTQDIITISILFPNLEHLTINTRGVLDISLLMTSLPYLRSLTSKIVNFQFPTFVNNGEQLSYDQLRRYQEVLFQREHKWITHWIDRGAFRESNWQTF